MPLARQVIPVALKNLDQSQPRETSASGILDEVLNMVARKGLPGQQGYEFFPRFGAAALAKTADAGTISTGKRIATLGSGLVMLTNDAFYRKAADQWHRVAATVPRISVQSQSVYAGTLYVDSVDSCYVNGYTVSIYIAKREAVTAQVRYTVRDSTGTAVVADQLLDTVDLTTNDVALAKVRAVGTRAVLSYRKGPTAGGRTIVALGFNSATPSAALVTANVTTNADANWYELQTTPAGAVAFAWNDRTSTQLTQALVTPSTMAVGTPTTYATLTALTAVGYLTNSFSSAVLYVAHFKAGSGVRVTTFDAVTLALGTTTTFDGAAANVMNLAGYRAGSTVTVYFSVSGAHIFDAQIKVSTGAGSSVVLRSIHLGSRVLSANGTLYALGYYRGASDGTGSFFLLDLGAGVVVGKALQGLAPMCTTFWDTPEFAASVDANTWVVAARRNVAATTSAGTLTAYVGCSTVTFKYGDSTLGRPVELNAALHIPGSMPYYYDGQSVVEHGFPVFPEPSDTPVPGPGGSMTPGSVVSYIYVDEWTDAAGNLCRSSPTITTTQVTLGATDTQVTHSIPTSRLTRKTNVSKGVYRTLPLNEGNDDSIFYKVSSSGAPVLNDPTVDRVTFVDQISDDDAAAGEPCYINGGVLENIAPPPCTTFAIHKGRLLCAGVDGDPSAIWFSKDVEPAFGVSFNDGLISRLSSTSQPVTALATMKSYAVACTLTTTWTSGDDYPDDLGNGGVLKFIQQSEVVGCSSPGLASRSDGGVLIWAGSQGPWFMSEGLDLKYAGAMIQDDAATMTPAAIVLVPSQNQTRIVGSLGSALATAHVLEGSYGTWSKWTYAAPAAAFVDATVWSGAVAYLAADGTVFVESQTTYLDALAVEHRIAVSEASFAGVRGFNRIYEWQFPGRILGDGAITLSVTQIYDDVSLVPKSLSYAGADQADLDLSVDPDVYGKSSSAGLIITDNATGTDGTAWTLSGATARVGIKEGPKKVGPSRRAA